MCAQLARYLNRNYWEKKQEEARKSPTPSAPAPLTEPAAPPAEGHAVPASALEVGGAQRSGPTVLGWAGGALRLANGPLISSASFQTPLPETDAQPVAPSSGPFGEVSCGSLTGPTRAPSPDRAEPCPQ